MRQYLSVLVSILIVIGTGGCVRRTMTFTTVPEGSRVFVNDADIGQSPATVEFTWYGDYEVIYRMEGYQSLKTHYRIDPPVHQLFPLDFFAEVLWPGEIHDHRDMPVEQLVPAAAMNPDELTQRAMELRDQALFQTDRDAQTSGNQ